VGVAQADFARRSCWPHISVYMYVYTYIYMYIHMYNALCPLNAEWIFGQIEDRYYARLAWMATLEDY